MIWRSVAFSRPEHEVEVELAVEVGVGEAVGMVVELGMLVVVGEAQRIELGDQMAAHAIGADQHDHPQMIVDQRLGAGSSMLCSPAAVAGSPRPAADAPGRGSQGRAGALEQRPVLRLELVEIGAPARVDRGRIGSDSGRTAPR